MLGWITIAAALAWTLAAVPPVLAQPKAPPASRLQAGIALYAAASYDEALTALDAARAVDLPLDDCVTLDRHRMLCLLALGRMAAADEAAASLLESRPDFVLTAHDAAPRVRAMFDETRRRVLPAVVRRVYSEAKRAYDNGRYAEAGDGFTRLAGLLADPHVAAADPAFADLGTLTEGFLQLTAAAIERQAAQRDYDTVQAALAVLQPSGAFAAVAAPAPAVMSAPALEAAPSAASAAAALPFTPLGIFTYDWRDKDVVPPVAVDQGVSGWWGSMGAPAAGAPLGAIEVVVDEDGRVVDARIYQSVNRIYDTVLLESVKQWRYQPATKDGRPVKYRRITGVVAGR